MLSAPHPLAHGQRLSEQWTRRLVGSASPTKFAVILFVRGPWCPVCRRQIARFSSNGDEFTALETALCVVSTCPTEDYLADASLRDAAVRYIHDADGVMLSDLGISADHPEHGVIAKPTTLIIDQAGTIQYAHTGRHPRDRPEPAAIMLAVRLLAMA